MPKIRVVVNMHGGTIESVCTESDVELDVVFLEDPKYSEDPEDKFLVDGGEFDDQIVYTHYASTKVDAEDMDAALKAAQERMEKRK